MGISKARVCVCQIIQAKISYKIHAVLLNAEESDVYNAHDLNIHVHCCPCRRAIQLVRRHE